MEPESDPRALSPGLRSTGWKSCGKTCLPLAGIWVSTDGLSLSFPCIEASRTLQKIGADKYLQNDALGSCEERIDMSQVKMM